MNETQRRARYNLIIIVKSSPANDARRGRLRRLISKQTHKPNTTIGLLFSLGVPVATSNQPELLDTISNEAARFDDIILTDFTDTYYNLTFKTLLNLRFAHVACGGASPLFAFMDDDHGLNLAALLDYFHTFEGKHQGQLRHSVFGFVYQRPKVIREPGHKWALTRSEMPFYMYPAYAAGPCYVIGTEAVAALSIAAAFTKPLTMEDAYVGLIAAKLGIKMHNLPDVHLHGPRQNKKLKRVPLIASLEYFEKHIS
ncbi:unnamed protein product [Dibothriocephalus latus]|uniref:Hexosyltransferase n=1 Tax=Dibothriocephalus latus TaxID=60516 RepID=A0A3P7P502_DIBLA|nr:unnamed protein product [Dibothriocephalus latus]